MSDNKTSAVEKRLRDLFLIIREIINTAVKANGLPRTIAEGSDDPHGLVFHIGNRAGNLDKLTGPNIAQGRGFTIVWPDSKGVETKRQCGTVFMPSGLQDDLTAAAVLFPVMIQTLGHINKGTDNLPALLEQVALDSGLTKTGKLSKALSDKLSKACKAFGPWPLPGLVKATAKKKKQGHRGPVKAYCAGLVSEDGQPCMIEHEQAKPSQYWRAFNPATADEEIETATCWYCGGPLMKKSDYNEMRKNTEVEVEVEI